MYRYGLLIFIFLLFILSPHSQDTKTRALYQQLYVHAEALLKSAAATAITDSLAFNNYLQVIAILNKEKKIQCCTGRQLSQMRHIKNGFE